MELGGEGLCDMLHTVGTKSTPFEKERVSKIMNAVSSPAQLIGYYEYVVTIAETTEGAV